MILHDLPPSRRHCASILLDHLSRKSPLAYTHSTRTAHFAALIAVSLKLPPRQVTLIIQSALVHEAGIPAAYAADCPRPLRRLLENLNERWDGLGGPKGKKGPRIPLLARVFAVAHTLEHLTSHRQFQCASGLRSALAELALLSGSRLDPAIVDAARGIPPERWDLPAHTIH